MKTDMSRKRGIYYGRYEKQNSGDLLAGAIVG